jgi:hypothetical protein
MAKFADALSPTHLACLAYQKIHFVASAPADSRFNLSPKGIDTFRALSTTRVGYLAITGSGHRNRRLPLRKPPLHTRCAPSPRSRSWFRHGCSSSGGPLCTAIRKSQLKSSRINQHGPHIIRCLPQP